MLAGRRAPPRRVVSEILYEYVSAEKYISAVTYATRSLHFSSGEEKKKCYFSRFLKSIFKMYKNRDLSLGL